MAYLRENIIFIYLNIYNLDSFFVHKCTLRLCGSVILFATTMITTDDSLCVVYKCLDVKMDLKILVSY